MKIRILINQLLEHFFFRGPHIARLLNDDENQLFDVIHGAHSFNMDVNVKSLFRKLIFHDFYLAAIQKSIDDLKYLISLERDFTHQLFVSDSLLFLLDTL